MRQNISAPRAGDAELMAYHAALTKFVARRLPERADVEDLVQEALARFVATAEAREIQEPQAYLFQIARNLVTDHYRRLAKPEGRPDFLDETNAPPVAPCQELKRNHEDLQRLFEAALLELPPRCREVFVLSKFEDMQTWAIAIRLKITPRMVQKHLANALTHFYARLGAASEI